MTRIASVLLLLLLAACAHTKTPDVYVKFEQGSGLWNLPEGYNYKLTLYADGNFKYEGILNGRPARMWGKVDPKRVAYLMQEAEAVPEWHCPDITTDQPYAVITVYRHGVTRSFDVDLGDPCTPDSARDVAMDLRVEGKPFTNGR